MSATKIEWADKRWNVVTGCSPISEGCDHCYAKRMAHRLAGRFGYPADDPFRVTFHPNRLELPLRWRKPSRIFVNSMGDLFHRDVDWDWLHAVFQRTIQASQHTYQVLTKRPGWMRTFFLSWTRSGNYSAPNIQIGVTVENAKHKDRIDVLRKIPAAVRFISFEPLLGDVGELDLTGIHWVIVGGETGPGARSMNGYWIDPIHSQCKKHGIPFFFKKWGYGLTTLHGRECREFPQG